MSNKCMLTTFDNPYNPFEQFTTAEIAKALGVSTSTVTKYMKGKE